MKYLMLGFIYLLVMLASGFAQTHHNFEVEKWLGTWEGVLDIYYPVKHMEVPVKLEITKTEADTKLGWKSSYDNGKLEKSYFLIAKDSEKGHYILDEDNLIELDFYFADNTFYSIFEVEEVILTSVYRLEGNVLVMEVTSSDLKTPNITGKDTGDLKEVKSYPVFVTQKSRLTKK